MFKIIVIYFAIVFVYYCEINAEINDLEPWKTPAADVRRILSSKNKFPDNKPDGILLRSNANQRHAKFKTEFREDLRGPHKEYVLRNVEARYNDLEHHVGKKRRFKRSYRDKENKQIDEHDNETIKPIKKKRRHHHHSRRKMNKKHISARNRETNRYKNDKKKNDIEEKHNEDKNKKHHYHSKKKINKHNDSSRYKTKKRYKNKNEDRHMNKYIKLNKKNNHSKKKNKDKNHSKYSKHPNKDKDYIDKKKRAKDKSKDKHDHKHNGKQILSKSDEKQREESTHAIDKIKTAIGMAGLGAAGVAALVGKSLASMKEPKPKPEPVQEQEVVRQKNLIKRERLTLTTKEKTRATEAMQYYLNKQHIRHPIFRQNEEGSGSSLATPPITLSPYAIKIQMEYLIKMYGKKWNATVLKTGRTVEYNDIVLVKVTEKMGSFSFRAKESKYVDEVPEKKIIFIVHGLTVMGLKDMTSLVNLKALEKLLSYYFKHLDKFDFFLMPLANPDGYSASFSRTPWNKNVSPQSVCSGVFVDRNFDVAWNSSTQISSCSQLYPGASPFSEEESRAVRDIFHSHGHKMLAYIHVHAGTFDDKVFKGDAILYPRGYSESQTDDDKYIDIKGEVDEAMKNASFRVMSATVDTLYSWYGEVTGTSVDYAATVYGIPYAMEFVMQLYDSEEMNFIALTEIWSRLIDATFINMARSLQAPGDARKY